MSVWWSFERQLSRSCYALFTWFPRITVQAVLIWGIWGYFSAIRKLPWFPILKNTLGLFGLVIWIMSMYSYNALYIIGPGSPLDILELVGDEEEDGVPVSIRNSVQAKKNGKFRYCSKCRCWKPDRAHHCSSCRRCQLKMDHHCPWFSACVGFRNHKLFIQLLWYSTIFCILAFAASLIVLTGFLSSGGYETDYIDVNLVLLCIIAGAAAVAIGAFSAYTTWLLLKNLTTLELMEGYSYRTSLPSSEYRYRDPPSSQNLKNVFDLGSSRNLRQVLGERWVEWLLPIEPARPEGFNGSVFPVNKTILDEAEQRAQTELSLLSRERPGRATGQIETMGNSKSH